MAYIRFYSPVRPAYSGENSNEAFERISRHFNTGSNCDCYQGSLPASNIAETDREFNIEMALPGVDKKNIKITHENGFLTVSVEKPEDKESDENYTRQEFDYSGTSRTFKTSDKIDSGNIAAKYENGILRLTLPKKEEYAKNRHNRL